MALAAAAAETTAERVAVRPAARFAPYVIAVCILLSDILLRAMGSFGWVEATEGVVDRTASLVVSPLYGGEARQGQKEIVIVGLDDQFASRWPPTFEQTDVLLNQILDAHPKAVFLDFFFPRTHFDGRWPDESGADRLAATLRRHSAGGHDIPILTGPITGLEWPLPKLAAAASQVGLTRSERLFAYDTSDPDGRPMAAAALYSIWLGHTPPKLPETLSLDWGFGVSRWAAAQQTRARFCQADSWPQRRKRVAQLAVRAALPNLGRDNSVAHGMQVDCPYFDVVSAGNLDEPAVKARLKGSLVLVGATLPGESDHAASPVLGDVPGVMVHAMALDNLIQNGARATRYPTEHPGLLRLDDSELWRLALLTSGFAVIWAWRGGGQRLTLGGRLAVWTAIGGCRC
jgi:CHASE2 domain-containing sensor protein